MRSSLKRETRETQIDMTITDEGPQRSVATGCGFLDHMLDLMICRAGLGVKITASGDLAVDAHHLTEDCGITLGQLLRKTAYEHPIRRYGSCLLPMDGSLARVALDFSGRGGLWWRGEFPSQKCGDFDVELVPEFFAGMAREAGLTLHIALLEVDNTHHAAEAVFKGVGLALKEALEKTDAETSTKGLWQ